MNWGNIDPVLAVLIAGLGGALIGAILAPYCTYLFNRQMLKKEIIFKEKVKNYENIREKVRTLNYCYESVCLSVLKPGETGNIKQSLSTMTKVFQQLNMFTPPKREYLSYNIKNLLEEYERLIQENNKKEKFTREEIFELTKKFNSYTNRILEQMDKEIGLKK